MKAMCALSFVDGSMLFYVEEENTTPFDIEIYSLRYDESKGQQPVRSLVLGYLVTDKHGKYLSFELAMSSAIANAVSHLGKAITDGC
jgi:alpha-galactosidase